MIMRLSLITLLILGFAAVSIFGFSVMNHENESGHYNCVAAATAGINDCSESETALNMAVFHLNAFKSFSDAIPNILTLILFILLLPLAVVKFKVLLLNLNFSSFLKNLKNFYFLPKLKIIHWLSIHENSPSLAF